MVDAGAAVRLAETWTAVRTEANLITATVAAGATGVITTGGVGAVQNFSTNFTMTQPANTHAGFRVDRLEVDLSLVATLPSELTITLTSPNQTTITMVRTPGNAFTFLGNDNYDGNAPTAWPAGGFTMATPGFWGETGVGTWTLTVSAAANAAASSLTGATLRIFGDSSANGAADLRLTEILTDDYARLANLDARRATIGTDGETGINASAMTFANFIDLNGVGQTNLGGRAVTLAGNTLRDYFGGASEDTALGNALGNKLSGGWGRDVLYGFGGNDTLNGGSEIDMLYGGAGADVIDGGADLDFARYDDSAVGVVVRLDVGSGLNGDAQGDTIIRCEGLMGSAQQDFLIGDANTNILFGLNGDDWLFGQGGVDYLYGGAGSDQILGGAGEDWLYGEAGNDQFWFLAADFEVGVFDRIMDFSSLAENMDFVRLEGVARGSAVITQLDGYVHITTAAVGNTGGVVIFGATVAQLNDVITFA
jgi:Ca2+-binding RTX toxin-like protein